MRSNLYPLQRGSASDSVLLNGALLCALIIAAVIALAAAPAQHKLSASEARGHIGESATVCGTVAGTRYAPATKGQPTFLNLDKPYPQQIFTVLIWGENRAKFGKPEVEYKGKKICATGKITEYRGTPEIVASDPGQLSEEK